MRLLKTDLVDILLACINRKLKNTKIEWKKEAACCIVCSSGGYPGDYERDIPINGLNVLDKNIIVFHAGTKQVKNQVLTNGGRVIGLTAVGKNLSSALSQAYRSLDKIYFKGMHFRKDIGV